MSNLVELYKQMRAARQLAHETIEGIYLDLGFEMPFGFRLRNGEQCLVAKQVTIREVTLPKSLRRQGQLTALVCYLLEERKLAVQLEAVVNPWLRARLQASPLWHCCSDPSNTFNPSFVRFPDKFKSLF